MMKTPLLIIGAIVSAWLAFDAAVTLWLGRSFIFPFRLPR